MCQCVPHFGGGCFCSLSALDSVDWEMCSSVKFPQSVMIYGQCHLLVLGHCVLKKKNKVTAPDYQEILENSMLPSADQLFVD